MPIVNLSYFPINELTPTLIHEKGKMLSSPYDAFSVFIVLGDLGKCIVGQMADSLSPTMQRNERCDLVNTYNGLLTPGYWYYSKGDRSLVPIGENEVVFTLEHTLPDEVTKYLIDQLTG